MGFDCKSFNTILEKFGPMFSGRTPFDQSGMIVEFEYVSGRKRKVQPADCLGLVLVWTRTRGPLNVLQLVFGLTYTNLSVYLRFGIRPSRPYFVFAPMGQYQLPFSMSLDQYTTVRLLSSETYTKSWRMCICQWGQSAALTRHLTT